MSFQKVFSTVIATGLLASSVCLSQTNAPTPPDGLLTTPYRVEIVAGRLQAPWSVVFAPDGRMFFSERPGWVRVIENGKVLEQPALVLRDVAASVKMGLLGLALSPGFNTNHFVYLAYNYDPGRETYRMRVVRYREKQNRLIEPKTLIEDIPAYRNHTGGRLRFGPDGCLYIATGDANTPPLSQKPDSLAGKILRINPDGSIPADNPFVNHTNAHRAIWSYGHRNPQGLAFQPGTDALFAPEHGPDNGDEINRIIKGGNYGWPIIHHRQSRETMHSPVMEFTPSIGPAAATFYRGRMFPELTGKLLVGCLRGEGILSVGFSGVEPVSCERLLHFKHGRIRDVVEGPDGFVYFTTSQFDPPEGTPRPEYDFILRLVPKSVSETGAVLAAEWNGPRPQQATFDPATTNAGVLIAAYCAPCHGPDLRGGMQRGLLYGNWQIAKDDDGIRRVIKDGWTDKGMPAFGRTLSPDQTASLISFIRSNQSTEPEPVPRATPPGNAAEFE
jgi:glucose/arabinose dehydrogenase